MPLFTLITICANILKVLDGSLNIPRYAYTTVELDVIHSAYNGEKYGKQYEKIFIFLF